MSWWGYITRSKVIFCKSRGATLEDFLVPLGLPSSDDFCTRSRQSISHHLNLYPCDFIGRLLQQLACWHAVLTREGLCRLIASCGNLMVIKNTGIKIKYRRVYPVMPPLPCWKINIPKTRPIVSSRIQKVVRYVQSTFKSMFYSLFGQIQNSLSVVWSGFDYARALPSGWVWLTLSQCYLRLSRLPEQGQTRYGPSNEGIAEELNAKDPVQSFCLGALYVAKYLCTALFCFGIPSCWAQT